MSNTDRAMYSVDIDVFTILSPTLDTAAKILCVCSWPAATFTSTTISFSRLPQLHLCRRTADVIHVSLCRTLAAMPCQTLMVPGKVRARFAWAVKFLFTDS